jgi:hypothetical protein
MEFAVLAERVGKLWHSGWSAEEILKVLVEENVAPPLGCERWDRRTLDYTLLMADNLNKGMAQDSPISPSP